jgi:hypothetical protein
MKQQLTDANTAVNKSKVPTVIGLIAAVCALLLSPEYIGLVPEQYTHWLALAAAILAALGAPLTKK